MSTTLYSRDRSPTSGLFHLRKVDMTKTRPETRRERSAAAIKQAKVKERRRSLILMTGGVAVAVAILGTLFFIGMRDATSGTSPTSGPDLTAVSGLGANTAPPWPLPVDTQAQVKAAGMSLGRMGTAEHYHAHLDILVDGKPVGIPVNVGVDSQSGAMAAVHTHSNDGLIHVEAGTKGQPFTLGQLFSAWNVRLTADQIGSLTTGGGTTLKAFVDGKEISGNPALIRLAENQQIALVYGVPDPNQDIPKTFDFGSGL